ncbi:MAG: hypothetical protein IT375_15130 [Polyangiaceae bacterium]|nr:hypothetical protein [Polyangiaceae bacterium]
MDPVAGRFGAFALMGAFALGCSAEVESYGTDADTASSAHALVTVERSVNVDGSGARADVLAGFVRVPADVEARPIYELIGLRTSMPPVGQCRDATLGSGSTPTVTGIGRVELLEAGEVWVGAQGSEGTLAPHAFPTVTDQIAGVLYASRDRSASAFPAASSYSLRTAGSASMPSIAITREAPVELDTVTIGGVALAELKEVGIGAPIDLTWGVGASGDLVIAELSTADRVVACAFRDDQGAGTIPSGKFDKLGSGRLSLTRIRTASFRAPDVDFGELAFQFELGTNVTFKP